jgi:hypothetical protein
MLTKPHLAFVCAVSFVTACTNSTVPEASNQGVLSPQADKTLARFEATGETSSCVPTRRIRSIKALSETLLLVRVGANDYYLNRPTSKCEQATKDSSALRYQIDGVPNLCTGETVNVVSNRSGASGLVIGSCALGTFEELRERVAT